MPTILLIEDNETNASLVQDIFQYDDLGAELVVVESGEEALCVATRVRPDLVLMDLRLPGMNGLEATQALRENPLTKDIPVWAITAYAMLGDEESARAAGCCEYITKPLQIRDLSDRLKSFLRDRNRRTVHV
jgi:CheY-like chemotaxis protein